LRTARAAQTADQRTPSPAVAAAGWFSNFSRELKALCWPHPKAWAGLAMVWILIAVLNLSQRDAAPHMAMKPLPPSPEMVAELKQQQRMFAELIGSPEPMVADRQKIYSPKPRTEHWGTFNV
jgi:hypothetical protein